jgi:hypothetical protein
MADQFCVWPVNYTDCSLEAFFPQRRRNIGVFSQVEKEIRNIDIMKQRFITFRMRRTHMFTLGWSVPVRRLCHRLKCDSQKLVCLPPVRKRVRCELAIFRG